MGSLTGLLNLSLSALQANQAAIDITSNNVANANTPGYTEETANWQEVDSVSLSGGASVGRGASVTESSQRDRVLEQRVQQQTQLESSSSAESAALTQLQSVFGLTSTSASASSTTIGADVNAFYNSLSTLQASPTSGSARQAVLSAIQTLTGDFNSAASQISTQTSSLNQQVTGAVGQVNSLTASIAALNTQITSTSPNGDAGTLEDQRQQDLAQLSALVGFNQTTTQGNGLTLTTTSGALLVSEGQSYALSTAVVNGNVDVLAAAATGGQDVTPGLTGGQLGGVLQARDQDLPQVSSSLDTLAWAIGTQVNAQNEAGLDGNGNSGVALFTLPPTAVGAAALISPGTSNPSQIAAAAVGEGLSGGTNAGALSALQNAATVNGQTPAGFFAGFLTQLGDTVSSVANSNTVQQASLTQLTTQRNALSGVSLDQEAANLTQYQNSYEAAAKVFSIVDTLLASALNLGEETTVS
jgi:flagellar hook-associated protein 1 FlgK